MTGHRRVRVARAIRERLGKMIEREVSDPRVSAAGLISVSRVELNRDMSVAQVYLSFIGAESPAIDKAIDALEGAAGFLRGPLGRELGMAKVPTLRFVHDESVAFENRLTEIVRDDERRAQVGSSPAPDGAAKSEESEE